MSRYASSLRLVDGEDELILSPSSVSHDDLIFCTSNALESPVPRVVESDRLGRSGKTDYTSLHGGSVFTASLKIVGDDTTSRWTLLDQLKGMLGPDQRPTLYVWRDGWGVEERRCQLRGDSVSLVVDQSSIARLLVSISAVVPEGVLEASTETVITLRPGDLDVGTSYPVTYPFEYIPANNLNSTTVVITSTTRTTPYIRLWGGCTDPVFSIQHGDEQHEIRFFNVVLAPGNFLDIDFAGRRVFLNNEPSTSYLPRVDWATSDWWELLRGSSRVLFTALDVDLGCYAELSYRNRWLT